LSAVLSAFIAGRTQLAIGREQRRSDAKAVLDRYREPLLDAAFQLGDRIDNLLNREFWTYLTPDSPRREEALLTGGSCAKTTVPSGIACRSHESRRTAS